MIQIFVVNYVMTPLNLRVAKEFAGDEELSVF